MLGKTLVPLLAMAVLTAVHAQEAPSGPRGSLRLQTVVEKVLEVEDADGRVRTELVPVEVAVPGDEVVYTVRYTNVGEERAEHVLITNPIPSEMRYKADSAFGPGTDVVYSADGGLSYASASELHVIGSDGRDRPASADDYTHIRWLLNTPIDPGAQGFARFRAIVR